MTSERTSGPVFVWVSALLFVGSIALTIVWCRSMSASSMPMPGGWTMTMAWMRMPGQTWPGAAATFMRMWTVMMVAMMLPSLVPVLCRYRGAMTRIGETRLGSRTVVAGIGYFAVWTLFGLVVFPLGVALTSVAMGQPVLAKAVPLGSAAVVLLAGVLQFTSWKGRQLHCCRETPRSWRLPPQTMRAAVCHGLGLGADCVRCCGSLMTVALVLGVMDLRVMAAVGGAITAERLATDGERMARRIGVLSLLTGVRLLVNIVAGGSVSP